MEDRKGYFEILSKIVRRGEVEDYGLPLLRDANPVPFSVDNFHNFNAENNNLRMGFVDGGNNLIFLSPGQAIHLVRLYYSIFLGGRKKDYGRYTFIIDSRYKSQSGEYDVRIFDIDKSGIYEEEMTINEDEIEEREKIKGIGSYLRRIGEWLIIERIMDKCDIVVRDGSLQTGQKGEYRYADRIFEKNAIIAGLSKTCSILTTKGYSLIASIHHLSLRNGIKAPWYYNPIARDITTIKGDMFVAKLHPRSSYAFRCEVYPENYADEVFGALASISKDPVFLGYPYGLIDADINARISDEEAKMYKMILYDNADEFSRLESNAMNAHDIISEVR